VVGLTTYIQQWTSNEDESPSKSLAPLFLSKEEVNKMEKRKN
jgi:hypothetical protein